MHNVMDVTVLDSTDHLLEKAPRLVLLHLRESAPARTITHASLALGDNVVEELLSCILHHHDDVCRRREHLIPGVSMARRYTHSLMM